MKVPQLNRELIQFLRIPAWRDKSRQQDSDILHQHSVPPSRGVSDRLCNAFMYIGINTLQYGNFKYFCQFEFQYRFYKTPERFVMMDLRTTFRLSQDDFSGDNDCYYYHCLGPAPVKISCPSEAGWKTFEEFCGKIDQLIDSDDFNE